MNPPAEQPESVRPALPLRRDPRNAFDIVDANGFTIGSGTTPANVDALLRACNDFDRLLQQLKSSEAREARMREALELAAKLPFEINVSNYDHEDVCRLNERAVEVVLAARAAITEGARDE